jgi:hypothetical protein
MVPSSDISDVDAKIKEIFPNQDADSSSSSAASSSSSSSSSATATATAASESVTGIRKCSYFGKFNFFRSSIESDSAMDETETQNKKRKTDNTQTA